MMMHPKPGLRWRQKSRVRHILYRDGVLVAELKFDGHGLWFAFFEPPLAAPGCGLRFMVLQHAKDAVEAVLGHIGAIA